MQRLELNTYEKILIMNLIDAKRIELGLTIKSLCSDIIDVSYYSKLLTKNVLADTNIYLDLMKKLNYSYDLNFNWQIFERYNEVYDNMMLVEYDIAKNIVKEINQILINDNCLVTNTLRRLNNAFTKRLEENKTSAIDLIKYINCFNDVNVKITYLIKNSIIFNLNGVNMEEFVKCVDEYKLIDFDSNLLKINYTKYLMNKKEDGLPTLMQFC